MIRWLARRLVVPAPRFLGTSELSAGLGAVCASGLSEPHISLPPKPLPGLR